METFLVTGGAGFIGSNLVRHLLKAYPNHRIINLDALTYAGNPANLADLAHEPRHVFVQGNICNRELVEYLFTTYDIRGVFHLAAESHVDNSIADPSVFMQTNLIGTFTLVHAAYRHWMTGPFAVKPAYASCRFHHTSTDEVYGTLGETGLFTETTPYAPNPPYAASKAGADFIVRSYFHTFGLNATISNCSNNYGPRQHAEKLIPTVIRKALSGKPIPIYGDGKNIRDWLHVDDHCTALTQIHAQGQAGETYNIGSRNEQDNNAIAAMLCNLLDEQHPQGAPHAKLISYVKDRPGHDRRYAIDPSKLETALGWQPQHDFTTGLRDTVAWYVAQHATTAKAA